MLTPRTLLVTTALALLAGTTACNLNEPSYYPAAAPVEIGGDAMGDPFAVVELPFRAPRDDEQGALREESQRKGFDVHIVPSPPLALKIQAYADNFR